MADSGADKSVGVGRRKKKNQRKQQQRQEQSDGSKAKGSSSGTKKKQPRGGIQGSSASNDHTNDNAACNNVNELVNEDSTGTATTGSRSSNFKAEQAPGSGPGSGESEISQQNQPLKKESDKNIGSWPDTLQTTRPVAVESISSALDKPVNETAVVTPKHYEDQQQGKEQQGTESGAQADSQSVSTVTPESMNELDSKLENLNLEHTTASIYTRETATGSAEGLGARDSHSSTAGADTDPAMGHRPVLDSWEDAPESVPEPATDPASNVSQAEAASLSSEKTEDFQIVEKRGDLFEGSSDESLACCISGDLHTAGSIAELFENKFGGLKELSKPKTGELIDIQHDGRYIYYLVTRKRHVQKLASSPLKKCLTALKEHCQKHKVQKLSMPQVNCELDGVKWSEAADIIEEVFKGTRIVVTAYGDNDRSAGGAVGKKKAVSNSASAKASKAVSGPGVFHKEIKNFVFIGKEGNPIAYMQDGEALAYCVSADINPDDGFAATFQNYFGGVRELVKQVSEQKPGGIAALYRNGRYIYCLVTKKKETQQTKLATLRQCLTVVHNHCQDFGIQKMSMPPIGCEEGGLNWHTVAEAIEDIFKDSNMTITVYTQTETEGGADDPPYGDSEPYTMYSEKVGNLTYIEKKGDLFRCPENESLAHCISSDVRMGRGIAVTFKKRFGGVQELLAQGQQTGGLAVLKRQDRYIYYLVTKENFYGKPNLNTLSSSLTAMREHCLQHKVTRLSMPQIGSGLDGLSWPKVVDRIQEIFKTTNMVITVYCWSG